MSNDAEVVRGAGLGNPQWKIDEARVEVDKLALEKGFVEPNRGDLDDPSIPWLHGKPDYTLANLAYFKGKTRNHAAGSLEEAVSNLVKTWEMEGSHKPFARWTQVNHEKYQTQANGGTLFKGEASALQGNYNWLFADCAKHLYDYQAETFESSHQLFRGAFPDGFAWEVLDVFSGPPVVAFSWRHWAHFTGSYRGNVGKGELIEMYGFGVAHLDADGKLCDIKIYYKPDEFLEVMEGKRPVDSLRNGRGGFPDFAGTTPNMGCPFRHGQVQEEN